MTTKNIEISATNGAYIVDVPCSESLTISYNGGLQGTATAGIITVTASVPNTKVFNTLVDATEIDLAAPAPLTISGVTSGPPVDRLTLTLTGFTGTASDISLSVFYRV